MIKLGYVLGSIIHVTISMKKRVIIPIIAKLIMQAKRGRKSDAIKLWIAY